MPTASAGPFSAAAPTLAACLQTQSWHTLYALAQANQLPFNGRWSKTQAVAALSPRLAAPERLAALLPTLPVEAHNALRDLLAAGGWLPQPLLIARYGALRPYRPWRAGSPRTPWLDPATPTETLFYRGLLFPLNLGDRRRPQRVFALPADYHAFLTLRLVPAPLPPAPPAPSPSPPPLLTQLFVLLSYLHRAAPRPLPGGWLPPAALRTLATFLPTPPEPPASPRSERQCPALAFLHYLAERAGLLNPAAATLTLAPTALDWLAQPPAAQLRALWAGWSARTPENAARWQHYRLPLAAEPDPPARLPQLGALLSRWPPGTAFTLADLTTAEPALLRPAAPYRVWAALDPLAQAEYQARLTIAWTALLAGPLTWWGAVAATPTGYTLTPLGAALWETPGGAWPEPLPPPALRCAPTPVAEAFELTVAPAGEPAEAALTLPRRLLLEAFCPPDPAAPDRYRLAAAGVQSALQHGQTAAGLLTLLEAAAGPLPPALVAAIYRWAAAVERLTLRQVTLLETTDPALLQQLTADRRLRPALLETLSARAVRVNAARLPELLRRLAYRGYLPRLELPAPVATAADPPADAAVTLAAALRVYARLADTLGQPVPAPHTLAQAWQARLTAPQRDAAEQLAAALLAALHQAAPPDGDYHLPAPTGPLLALLEAAIADQATVEFTYYTAGRAALTRRRADPLRLEWRGDVAYLIAFCHLHQAQRVFRVDRMADLTRCPAPP